MTDRATDPAYLGYQYADSEKLRIREETHRLYSERPNDWIDWVLERVAAASGHLILDAGSGPGLYHPGLAVRGVRVVALDRSFGMAQEARDQARRRALPVEVLQADAQALPLPDGAFDRVMANHMLYHVPDQLAALRELRRVAKPGGRVVLATVAQDQNSRLMELHEEVAGELGLRSTEGSARRFTLGHLDLVRRVFPGARREVRHDAFVFPAAEPVVRYYASGMINAVDAPADDDAPQRAKLIDGLRRRVEAIIAREGVFRVPKDAGAFVAEV